jgi:hypothetical protein
MIPPFLIFAVALSAAFVVILLIQIARDNYLEKKGVI